MWRRASGPHRSAGVHMRRVGGEGGTDWLWDPEAWVLDERDSVDELRRSRERFVRELGCQEGESGARISVSASAS